MDLSTSYGKTNLVYLLRAVIILKTRSTDFTFISLLLGEMTFTCENNFSLYTEHWCSNLSLSPLQNDVTFKTSKRKIKWDNDGKRQK